MSGPIAKVWRFLMIEEGPTAVEYAVLLALITLGLVSLVRGLGNTVSGTLTTVSSTLQP